MAMAKKSARKTTKRKTAQKTAPVAGLLQLSYTLAELHSSQHRAGLAGLVLMLRWLKQTEHRDRGVVRVDKMDARGASFTFDAEGMQALFDVTYAAAMGESAQQNPRKHKKTKVVIEPIRTEERDAKDKTGKVIIDKKTGEPKTKTWYVYPQVVPHGAFLEDLDLSVEKLWVKQWRDMVWTILRGVPKQRGPFVARAERAACADGHDAFGTLVKSSEGAVELSSTYYLGAQAKTADNVPFSDRARYRFLLHFWPFVSQVYVPRYIDDGQAKIDGTAFVIAVPDIAELNWFVEELGPVMRSRGVDKAGYRPREAVIDVPDESGLDLMRRLAEAVRARTSGTALVDLLLGIDVFTMRKEGNNVRIAAATRMHPDERVALRYGEVKDEYWDHGFRRRYLVNLLQHAPWYAGFDRYLSTCSRDVGISSWTFRHDARRAFEMEVSNMSDALEAEKPLESLIYQVVGTYLSRKLESKYGLRWEDVKELPENADRRKELSVKKEKLAREAFLAVRSRTGADFIEYFSATLFSVAQHVGEAGYNKLTASLLNDAETVKVRTLTLLALSARA
jgi:CRISPR-associated protein Cmx8